MRLGIGLEKKQCQPLGMGTINHCTRGWAQLYHHFCVGVTEVIVGLPLRRRVGLSSTVAIAAIALTPLTIPAAIAAPAQAQHPFSLPFEFPAYGDSNYQTGEVRLDGKPLFKVTVTVPRGVGDENAKEPPPQSMSLRGRIAKIEERLKELVEDGQTPENISLTYARTSPQLYTIQADGEYLFTLNSLDASANNCDNLEICSQDIIEQIEKGLTLAYIDRQPRILKRRGIESGAIALSMIVLSLGVRFNQRRLRRRREQVDADLGTLKQELSDLTAEAVQVETDAILDREPVEPRDPAVVERLNTRMAELREELSKGRRLELQQEFHQRLLQLLQLGIWGGGTTYIFGLFPYTRWLSAGILTALSGPLLSIVLTGAGAYAVFRISFVAIDRLFAVLSKGYLLPEVNSERAIKRLQTFSGVLKGATAVTIGSMAGVTALTVLGANVGPILASAGILGLGISLGAQNLIKDVINGSFILIEDQFGVGDVIAIAGATGLVESLNLRITKLRSADGNLITIPNGQITTVENLTNGWSRANLAIDVAYSTDLDRAIAIIDHVASRMAHDPKWRELIVKPPQVLGVDNFGDNSITIRLWIDTQPLKQWEVAREFRRRLKHAFDRQGISMPFPQRSIWFRNSLMTEPTALEDSPDSSEMRELVTQVDRKRDSGVEG